MTSLGKATRQEMGPSNEGRG
uniref:Uncharacterized protein n=1 Tax=Arundo donax TaxID=35708 RepID=A0A0A9DNL0_ARUDO